MTLAARIPGPPPAPLPEPDPGLARDGLLFDAEQARDCGLVHEIRR